MYDLYQRLQKTARQAHMETDKPTAIGEILQICLKIRILAFKQNTNMQKIAHTLVRLRKYAAIEMGISGRCV